MTPLEISMALHYYTTLNDYPNIDSMSQRSAIKRFIDIGFLVEHDGEDRRYQSTDKLKAYCEELQKVPVPTVQYIFNEG